MYSRANCLAGVTAIAAVLVCVCPARGQSNSGQQARTPPRTAQRAPARQDGPPPANSNAESRAPRAPSDAPARATSAPNGSDSAGQPSGQTPRVVTPKAPFVLSESQQKLLDQILLKWEKQSDKVKTFRCNFTRWEYDAAFGNPQADFKKSQGQGEIRYRAPDCGAYVITEMKEYDPARKVESPKTEGLDHWVCDGKAIFEFNADKKLLIERRLPPELQGKAIADGPLPFIFGAKADQLKRRYWMRDVTPKDDVGKKIWLEAVPKYQQDAANFQSATVILNESDFMPSALRIFLPGGKSNSDYSFVDSKMNDPLAVFNFIRPRLSPTMMVSGWKHVVEDESSDGSKNPKAPTGEAAQAVRPASASGRK